MSLRFWTADPHFSHANIAKYCNRPIIRKGDLNLDGEWTSPEAAIAAAERMDKMLITHYNARIKADDTVCNVGDFLNFGSVKGTPGLRNREDHYLNQLNGRWTLIEGNHDKQNDVACIGRYMFTNISKMRVFVSHYPTNSKSKTTGQLVQDPDLMKWVKKNCAFAICGHVHNGFRVEWDDELPNINVGVDVHKFYPIHDNEIYNIFLKAKQDRINARAN